MRLRVENGRIFRTDLKTRMPFRYGIATVTDLPHVFVEIDVKIAGETVTGIAADHLAPKWFTKNPNTAFDDDIAEMLHVIRQAIALAKGLEGRSPFAIWRTLYDKQAAWGKRENLAPLLTNFGVSLVERAVLDAFCKKEQTPFHELLSANALGIDWEGDPDFSLAGKRNGKRKRAFPPALTSIKVRHTVGLSDPLTDADILPEDRLNDGLPQSLEACIKAYGLTHFKLKVGGNRETDAARLSQTVRVIAETVETNKPGANWRFSIDGNESYRNVPDFRVLWLEACEDLFLRRCLAEKLLFVEQPLHRDAALKNETGDALAKWPDRPPILIDESDAELASFPRALSLGYAGTSHKNCKGVFKGIRNAAYLRHCIKQNPQTRFILSGEDLTNIGPVALMQDLAVQAALGIQSVERNGQHYFAGLSQFPETVQKATLAAHPDLLVRLPQGFPTLRIQNEIFDNGFLDLTSINAAPFGTTAHIAPETWAERMD